MKLGSYGISADDIGKMTQQELGWLKQADLIDRGRAAPVVLPWFAPSAKTSTPSASGGHTQTFISKRKKK